MVTSDRKDEIHDEKIDKLFPHALDEDPASANARSLIRDHLAKRDIHPSQCKIIFGNNLLARMYQRTEFLQQRAEQAERENYMLRAEASKDALKKLKVIRNTKARTWEELTQILSTKITMKRGWKVIVGRALGVTVRQLHEYETGVRPISDELLTKAHGLPRLSDPTHHRAQRAPNSGPIPQIPPTTGVMSDGPMSVHELQLIGLYFDRTDWREGVARVATARKKTIMGWVSRGVPAGQAALLRQRYREAGGAMAA